MSIQFSPKAFVAAGTTTFNIPGGGQTHTFALPTVDGANTSLIVSHTCSVPIYVQIGSIASMPAGPSVAGSLVIRPGETVLLTAGNQGTSTFVGVNSPGVGTITFTRGTAAGQSSFATSDDAVRV
jgi:hypothetical protein